MPRGTLDLAFRFIKHVPWIESELDKEPQFLPTMFPLCLLGSESTQGIGFGYRTYIPCYTATDLHRRLLWLLKEEKEEPIIRPISTCKILSPDAKLKELLTTGKATIEVQGITRVTNARHRVVVKSWPPGKRFESVLSKLSKELENQDIGFQDLSSGDNGTNIVFEVIKQRNKNIIFEKFVPKLQEALKGNISYELVTVDTQSNVGVKSVDQLLVQTFKMYTQVNARMLDFELNRISEIIKEYELLEKLKPFISKYMGETVKDVDKVIRKISNDAREDFEVVKQLFSKYHIRKLLSVNTDTKDLSTKIKELEGCKKDLHKFVLTQYGSLLCTG